MGVVIIGRTPTACVRGTIATELCVPDGEPFGKIVQPNMLTDRGIAQLLGLFAGTESTAFTHMQIGTGGRVVAGEEIPNPKFDSSLPESDNNRRYLPVGTVKPITPDREALYAFYDEEVAIRTVNGANARFVARFEIPVDVPVNEAGIFAGSVETSPLMLNVATFIDTVQRIRMTKATPTTDTIWFNVTWDVAFERYPFGRGYHEVESSV